MTLRQQVAEPGALKAKSQQVDEVLQQGEDRLRLLLEDVKDFAIFLLDANGRIASWTKGAERLFGYQEAEILGQPYFCLFTPEDNSCGVPDQELRTAEAQGRNEDERWHVHKDGTRFCSSDIVTALRDETGNLRG